MILFMEMKSMKDLEKDAKIAIKNFEQLIGLFDV